MSITAGFTLDRSPAEAYAAINDVRSWWTGDVDGPTDLLGGSFTYRYGDAHRSTQRVAELVPHRRVVWEVTDADLSFAADPREWVGTRIVFDLLPVEGGTQVQFEHEGLTPLCDCFEACSNAWGSLITASLRERIESTAT